MRSAAKSLAIVIVTAALLGSVLSGTPTAASVSLESLTPSQQQQLQAERAQLVAQLQTLLVTQGGASTNLSGAEANYVAAEGRVEAARKQLDEINTKLKALAQTLDADQKTSLAAKGELATLARQQYETTGNNVLLSALASSSDFSSALARMKAESHANAHITDLIGSILDEQTRVTREQADLKTQFAKASEVEKSLEPLSNQLLAAVLVRNQEMSSASAPVRALESQIAGIDSQLEMANMPGNVGDGPCGNRFSYGQCTYYVASRRCIPWSGNADEWFYAAAAYGYKEGHSPVDGAVVVFWPGGDGASGVGHVAYVEQVGPEGGVPPGYFRLSEMNFGGWNRVNYRILPNGSGGIQGFVYGHG